MGEVDAAHATYRSINALCWSPAVIWKCSGRLEGSVMLMHRKNMLPDLFVSVRYCVRLFVNTNG